MIRPMIMVAPNGAHRGKLDHPALPITIAETIDVAKQCFQAGATALHLHVRDEEGKHSLDAGRYREAIAELSKTIPAMPIQITTEAAGIYSVTDQLNCLQEIDFNWASISVREIARMPELADAVYGTCADQNTQVQHILYDANDAQLLKQWLSDGTVREAQRSVLLVLGRYSEGQQSHKHEIKPLLDTLPAGVEWMLCAFGQTEHECLLEAATLGGNCRVGFENSLENFRGEVWPDNTASVAALCAEFKGA